MLPLVPITKEVAMIERKEFSREDIAHRAYELYTQRGCGPGKDVEDWIRARGRTRNQICKSEGCTPRPI
jgi:hypothetical protein